MRKHRIVEVIGLTWGGLMIGNGVLNGVPQPTGAYGGGETVAYLSAWVIAAASLNSFIAKRPRRDDDFGD
jgi:hypothetical protein